MVPVDGMLYGRRGVSLKTDRTIARPHTTAQPFTSAHLHVPLIDSRTHVVNDPKIANYSTTHVAVQS